MSNGGLIRCVGCGALVPDIDAPKHPYMDASAGCWAVYGGVLAKEYGEYRYPPWHRLSVDAYAIQHPGTPSPKTVHSVAVHLVRLCLLLERKFPERMANDAIRWATAQKERWRWLNPPGALGEITVVDVSTTQTVSEHERVVRAWAWSAWDAWAVHHNTVRQWAALLERQ